MNLKALSIQLPLDEVPSLKDLPWLRDRSIVVFSYVELLLILSALIVADPTTNSVLIGLVPFFLGLGLKLWTLGYPPQKRSSADFGPYRFLRYPDILSSLFILFGISFAARSFTVTLLAIIFVAIQVSLRIRWQFLAGHGDEDVTYPRYRAMVPAMIPNLWPYASRDGGKGFSWRMLLHDQHQIYLQTTVLQSVAMLWFGTIFFEPMWLNYSWMIALVLLVFAAWRLIENRSWRKPIG